MHKFTELLQVKISEDLKKELESEAESGHRKLTDHIRMILENRQKGDS